MDRYSLPSTRECISVVCLNFAYHPGDHNIFRYLALLANSKFLGDVDHIVDCFDKTTKPRFRSSEGPQYIRFGSASDNDLEHNIRLGQLKLEGSVSSWIEVTRTTLIIGLIFPRSQVARFFQPSVTCIVNAVLDQKMASPKISVSSRLVCAERAS